MKNIPFPIIILAPAFAVLALILDTFLPMGVAGGIPCGFLVLLGIWLPSKRHVYALAILATIITGISFLVSPPTITIWALTANRFLRLVIIWGAAVIICERKKLIKKSEDSNARLSYHLENSPLASMIWDVNFRCLEWNKEAEKVFGYSKDEMIGIGTIDCIVPSSARSQVDSAIDELSNQTGGAVNVNKNITKNGKTITCKWFNTIILKDDGTPLGFAAMAQDITQLIADGIELDFQKKAMDEHAIVSISNVDGEITYVNEKFCNASQYTRDELIDQNHRILKSEEHDPAFYTNLWETIIAGKVWKGDICNKSKDGRLYWVSSTIVPFLDDNGEPFQFVSMCTDITKNKELEQGLMLSESRLQRSQSFAHMGIWDWDISNDALYWSDQVPMLFGSTDGNVIKTYNDMFSLIHSDDQKMVINAVKACVDNGKEYDVIFRIIWLDGSVHWIHQNGNVVYDDDGNATNMLGMMQDITSKKNYEEQIILAKEEAVLALEEAQMANSANQAKSEFLATMSHEIRTPLNAIIGFAEALEMGIGAEDRDERNERLGIIANSGRQLNNLISDILDFSKVEAGKLEFDLKPTLPSDIFERCLPTIRQLAKDKNISFKGIKESNSLIFVDPKRLEQIILNFISNAVKYNKDNGSIEFGCYETTDNNLRVYVEDTGMGIPEGKEQLIFSPFDRVNYATSGIGGIGLGLAICKKLTESMNGEIGFETALGEGTTFWVEFPMVDA